MKKRKFTTLTIKRDGKTYKKSVAYSSVAELAEKRIAFEKECINSEKHFFRDVADQWFEAHEKTVEHYTAQSYLAPLKDLKADFGDYELKEIDSLSFQSFLNRMQLQGYAQQTIKLRKITMSQILDYGILNGYITYNPVKVCKIPKGKKETRLPPSDDEIEKIMSAPESMWKSYFLLLMFSGLRREEALALRKEDFDFENCTIRVNKALIFKSNIPEVRNHPKTAAGNRFAPFPINIHKYFKNAKNGLIFAIHGEPLTKGQFDHGIADFKKAAGITCNSHQLRHYFATLCHDVMDAKDAQKLLGHAKVSTTLDVYTHIDQRRNLEAIRAINSFVKTR